MNLNKILLFDGTGKDVQSLTIEEAQRLVTEKIAVPVGRRQLRGIKLLTDLSFAMYFLKGTRLPNCQGSRTFIKLKIFKNPVYEHHQARCRAFATAAQLQAD